MNIFSRFKNYKAKYLINDILSGLLVAIIALPLSIALGIQSIPEGVANGIQMGIITAIVAGFFVSFLGGSNFQIGGPTAAFVVIIFGYVANPEIGLIGLQFATLIAGLLLILLGILKCGNLVKYIPYPIIIGFTTGIGITLLTAQLKDFCGFTVPEVVNFLNVNFTSENFVGKIVGYVASITTFKIAPFLLGAGTLISIIVISKLNKKLPSAFISIVLFTIVNVLIGGEKLGIETIGSKYSDLKATFTFMDFSQIASVNFGAIIVPAIVIAFLGAIESLLSVTVADGMAKTTSNYNQELTGQGIANICSTLLGGLPATGAIARTSANINSGAKSSLSGMFHAVFILIMFFLLIDVVKLIPLCTLAAVLINVSISICNTKLFAKLARFGVRDSIILIVTMLLTVFFDLTYGVIGGFILTLILNFKNLKTKFSYTIEKEDNKLNNTEIEQEVALTSLENKVIIKIQGPIYFLNINKIINEINVQLKESNDIVLDLQDAINIDCTSIEKLAKLDSTINVIGKNLTLINYPEKVGERLKKYYTYLM